MPKCPVCLAAYVTLWTGLGLSFAQATYLRWSLLSLSGVLLCCLALKRRLRGSSGASRRKLRDFWQNSPEIRTASGANRAYSDEPKTA
jgi:hypothetical protein